MNSNNDIVITDGLISELEKNFGPKQVYSCDTWEKTCELRGQLKMLLWLQEKKNDLRAAQFENTETITIDSS